MKYIRSIAVMLILVLASSPSLAAICAASCASQSMHSNDIFEMQNCNEASMSKDKSTSNSEHKSCVLGAACHFAQVISDVDSLSKYVYADTSAPFSKLASPDKSVDSPPPLKPPA